MSEILEEFKDISDKKGSNGPSFYFKIVFLVCIVVGFGIYVGDMLFGTSSLEVLLNLQDIEAAYTEEVDNLKQENAILQKEYFELKDLDPDSNVQ